MKKQIFYFAAAIMTASLMTVSCEEVSDSNPVKLSSPVAKVTASAETSVTVSWDAVEGAAGYTYILGLEKAETVTETSVTFEGLEAGTDYTMRLKAVSDAGEEYDSDWTAFTFSTSDRPAPTFELTAVQVLPTEFTVKVVPSDKSVTWFVNNVTSKVWDTDYCDDSGVFDPDLLQSSDMEFWETMSSGGTSLSQVLNNYVRTGDQEVTFSNYVEPGTKSYAYVYGLNLDGTFTSGVTYIEIDTPAISESESTVKVEFTSVGGRDIYVTYTPDADVMKYYTTFSYKSAIDTALNVDDAGEWTQEAEDALAEEIITDTDVESSQGVKESHMIVDYETEYTICVAGYDVNGGRFFVRADVTSLPRTVPEPSSSALFDQLIGSTWSGEQRMDTSTGEHITQFTATIVDNESSMNYRTYNELAIQFSGYANIDYQSVADLLLYNYSERDALKAYGPKFVISIDDQDNITIDATEYQTPVYVQNYGPVYLKGYDGNTVSESTVMTVTLSEDGKTMTISDPAGGNYHPNLMLYGNGHWEPAVMCIEDMVLTRTN